MFVEKRGLGSRGNDLLASCLIKPKRNDTMKTIPRTNTKYMSLAAGGIASALMLGLPVSAQTEEEEIFELSPFTVDGSQDVGYRAQNTLSGTRTRTELKDVAASLTAYTQELLEDISASNFEELAGYAPNMEVDNYDAFQPYSFSVRGVPAQRTRNFFALDDLFFSTDFYSTERVESARGPNAILFGIAKPGGVLNVNTKRARLNRDSFGTAIRFDTWGSKRVTADINKVLIEDKLAVRFNILDGEERTWRQSHERSKEDRFHLTTTFTPNETSVFRVEWEHIEQDFKRSNAYHTGDNVSYYLDDDPDTVATRQRNTSEESIYDVVSGTFYDAERWLESNGPNRPDFDFVTDVPRDTVLMGSSPGREGEFDMITATWEQRVGDHFSFEITHYDLQSDRLRLGWSGSTGAGGSARIDLQPTLNDGSDNPNYGKYFTDSFGNYQNVIRDQQNTRATAVYDLDLAERNMGQHMLTAYFETHEYFHNENAFYEFVYDYDTSTPEIDLMRAGRPLDSRHRMITRVYFDDLSDSSQLKWADGIFDSIRGIDILNNVSAPGRTFQYMNGDGTMTTAETRWLTRSNTSVRTQGRNLDSKMAAWQGKFLEGDLIATLGYREDETDFFRSRSILDDNGYVVNELDPVYDMSPDGLNADGSAARSAATARKGTSRTASLLYHLNEKVTVAYNTSSVNGLNDEFRLLFPYASVPDLFKGSTDEISARFSMFDGALNTNITYYTLDSEGEVYRASNVDGRANNTWDILADAGGMIDGQVIDYNDVQITADYSTTDRRSEGIELSSTANLGKNVSLYFTFSQNDTKVGNLGASFYDYFGTIDPNDPTGRTLIGGVVDQWKASFAEVQSRVTDDPIQAALEQDNADRFFNGGTGDSGSLARFENEFFNQVTAFQNASPVRQSEYKSALRMKYRFREGGLKGSEISFGARYNSGKVIGAREDSSAIRSEDEIYFDLGLRHKRKVFDEKAELVVGINIKNLFDDDDAMATAAGTDGTVTGFRFITPRQTRFETSLKF